MKIFIDWVRKRFSDPQIAVLFGFLIIGAFIVLLIGDILAPVFSALIIAYLLEEVVSRIEKLGFNRGWSVFLACVPFFIFCLLIVIVIVPLLYRQIIHLVETLPNITSWIQDELTALPERYPEFVTMEQISQFTKSLQTKLGEYGETLITFSLASLGIAIDFVIYLILVPMMVIFILKDKQLLLKWLSRFLPSDRELVIEVWKKIDLQIGNYIRGKLIEIIIVWGSTSMVFSILGLQAPVLFAFFVGLSVLIPYVGAAVMTFPIAIMAYYQWEFSSQFLYVMIAYGFIQLIDGNILATLLFSEAVNLHPLAIILAVVVFGGLGGFWGVFFAIPLATMIQAVIQAWPAVKDIPPEENKESSESGNEI